MELKQRLTQLSTPLAVGNKSIELAAIRLTPYRLSTDKAAWTNDKLANSEVVIEPLAVFPDLDGALRFVFPDTVVVAVTTPIQPQVEFTDPETGKVTASYPKPLDPSAISKTVQDIFGEVGTVKGCYPLGESKGVQEYYISLCNLPFDKVYQICQDIEKGCYLYAGEPIKLVRLDATTNVPAAVKPSEDGSKELLEEGWKYKDNRQYVGDRCHSYVIQEDVLESKIYDKLGYMLEVGKVSERLGDNYKNLLRSSEVNINMAFRSPLFQQQGFGRIETRFWRLPSTLEEALASHIDCIEKLVPAHTQPTSLQDSYDTFLQPNHAQTLVIQEVNSQVKGVFCRHINKLTEKANGWELDSYEDILHTLKYRTMGQYAVNVYWVEKLGDSLFVTRSGALLPDMLHTGSLAKISEGHKSQAKTVGKGLSWDMVGLNIPLSLDNKNGKPRNLVFQGGAETDPTAGLAPIPESLDSQKTIERKAKQVESQRLKRLEQDKQKYLAQVKKDKCATAPTDWRKHLHISKLAEVAKPVCTRYYFDSSLKFPTYMVKVGKKWYKANAQLNRLLDKSPELPFAIQVWDSQTEYKGNKIWEVALKPYS